jgi:P-type Ca2+ transporter type 2C
METGTSDFTSIEADAHATSLDALFRKLDSAPTGLSAAEAAERLTTIGPNELQESARVSPWKLLADQFKNVLIIILLAATAASAAMGHGVEAIVIAVIVIAAALLGFVQEFRANRALDALRQMAAPHAKVVRDGHEVDVLAREIVPGDVVLLSPGDRTPADGRLLEAVNLQMEEAALTGESAPSEKRLSDALDRDAPLAERTNMAFAGTVVTYGRGRALVTATGMNTEFGGVARLIEGITAVQTPLQQNLDQVGKTLGKAALALVAVIVVAGMMRGQPVVDMLLFGVALAVAVVPEALPAVVTISLAIGVQKMARRNALIRRLPAVETLGCTTVICTDKTGTLTKDEMTAVRLWAADRDYELTGAGYEPTGELRLDGERIDPPDVVRELLTAGALACDAHLTRTHASGDQWEVQGDPTEGAIIVAAAKLKLDQRRLQQDFPRIDEIPFSSEDKRMTTLHQGPDGGAAFVKGAPEVVLEDCGQLLTANGVEALTPKRQEELAGVAQRFADDALRVLAIASKATETLKDATTNLTLLGLIGMIDPPRPEAKRAIIACRDAGVQTIMITGDHPRTAAAIAFELGILQAKEDGVIKGTDLENVNEGTLEQIISQARVYARVSPAHKLRLVEALQRRGEVVAMTGDGVNDAPALKKADIGIAMGITGTDVSKEAAAMTLTDDNFASIVAAVEEGRSIYANIKKYLMFLLSSNIGEIGIMVGAMAVGMPMPLTAVQILYVNLATDGLPALALAVDPPEPGLMKRPPRSPRSGIFTRDVITLMAAGGIWSSIVNLGVFTWAQKAGKPLPEAMTLTFVTLVLIQFFNAYNFRSDRISVWVRPFANRWLNLAVCWEAILLIIIVTVSPINNVFNAVPLSGGEWAIALIAAASVTPILETTKWIIRRRESEFAKQHLS